MRQAVNWDGLIPQLAGSQSRIWDGWPFPDPSFFYFPAAASGCRECPKGKADVGAPRIGADFPDGTNTECALERDSTNEVYQASAIRDKSLSCLHACTSKLSERALVCRVEFRGLGAWTSLPGYLRKATYGWAHPDPGNHRTAGVFCEASAAICARDVYEKKYLVDIYLVSAVEFSRLSH